MADEEPDVAPAVRRSSRIRESKRRSGAREAKGNDEEEEEEEEKKRGRRKKAAPDYLPPADYKWTRPELEKQTKESLRWLERLYNISPKGKTKPEQISLILDHLAKRDEYGVIAEPEKPRPQRRAGQQEEEEKRSSGNRGRGRGRGRRVYASKEDQCVQTAGSIVARPEARPRDESPRAVEEAGERKREEEEEIKTLTASRSRSPATPLSRSQERKASASSVSSSRESSISPSRGRQSERGRLRTDLEKLPSQSLDSSIRRYVDAYSANDLSRTDPTERRILKESVERSKRECVRERQGCVRSASAEDLAHLKKGDRPTVCDYELLRQFIPSMISTLAQRMRPRVWNEVPQLELGGPDRLTATFGRKSDQGVIEDARLEFSRNSLVLELYCFNERDLASVADIKDPTETLQTFISLLAASDNESDFDTVYELMNAFLDIGDELIRGGSPAFDGPTDAYLERGLPIKDPPVHGMWRDFYFIKLEGHPSATGTTATGEAIRQVELPVVTFGWPLGPYLWHSPLGESIVSHIDPTRFEALIPFVESWMGWRIFRSLADEAVDIMPATGCPEHEEAWDNAYRAAPWYANLRFDPDWILSELDRSLTQTIGTGDERRRQIAVVSRLRDAGDHYRDMLKQMRRTTTSNILPNEAILEWNDELSGPLAAAAETPEIEETIDVADFRDEAHGGPQLDSQGTVIRIWK